ncbi:MAG: hypothetical protein R3F53_20915 [Gammaproteobacteria bacterium]
MSAKFLRKLGGALAITSALAGGALWAPTSQAVNLADDGLGEVALYQYYTARAGWQTFFRIINTSDDMVPVKVRFRRAADSEDVLDFVVALSPRDMWVAWTDSNVDGNGNPGLITWDTSCLAPAPSPGNLSGWVSVPDTNRKYVTFKADGAEEGHVEMISLGRTGPLLNVATDLYADTLHGPDDTPDCQRFGAAFTPGASSFSNYLATSLQFLEPNNTLKANGYLINASTGQGMGYDPVMLANFFNPVGIDDSVPALLGEFFTAPPDFTYPDDFGSPLIAALYDEDAPDLNFAWPPVSQVQVDTPFNLLNFVEEIVLLGGDLQVPGPTTVVDEWDDGIDAVSAVLTRRSVINEWAARETNGASVSVFETEWVVTFPTRYPPSNNYYYPYLGDGEPAIAPFTDGGTPIHTALWNREERVTGCVSGIGQDTACQPNNNLPYEVNVITFRGESRGPLFPANRLGSQVVTNVPQSQMPVPYSPGEWLGWMELTFTGDQADAGLGSDARGNQTYDDLPPIDLTYNLGETIFLRDGGGVFQEYCLFDVLTNTGNATAPGPCAGPLDPQAICTPAGVQVGDVDPIGNGVSEIIFEITDDTLAGVQMLPGALVSLPNTLLLVGPYAQPFLAIDDEEPEEASAPVCDVDVDFPAAGDPAVPGTNPMFTIVPENYVTYRGMPVIGFGLGVYNLGGQQANYATAVDHGYKRDVRISGDLVPAQPELIFNFPLPQTVWGF